MLQRCCRRALVQSRRQLVTTTGQHDIEIGYSSKLTARAYSTSPLLHDEKSNIPLRKTLKDEAKAKRRDALTGILFAGSSAKDERLRSWELTVGIEIHAQLNTARKLFSPALTAPTTMPNAYIAPFDLSVPGTLPIFQRATLLPALRAALALNCTIQPVSSFDRKHYFYHDQPAGYQITQYYEPFARDGSLTLYLHDGVDEEVSIGIKQIQMEQDTARTQDQDEEITLIDYNRAGQPLVEIISLPHIHSPEVASAYVRKIQTILSAVDAVTTGMEMGGLRADINVSVRRKDAEPGKHSYSGVTGLGQRTEIKNLSSFKGVEDAIRAERDRQIEVLEAGGEIEGETRGWSVTKPGETRRLRSKEGEVDYRYMPDPDIAPLRIAEEVVQHLSETLPTVPDRMLQILTDPNRYKLSTTDAKILLSIDEGERVEYFQDVVDQLYLLQNPVIGQDSLANDTPSIPIVPDNARLAANFVLQDLGSLLSTSETPWSANRVSTQALALIIHHFQSHKITSSSAKQILKLVFNGDTRSVEQIIQDEGLEFKALSEVEYEALAREIVEANEKQVKEVRDKGVERAKGKIMFLVGQMMKRGEVGRVEAKKCEEVLRTLLMVEGRDGPQ